MIPINYGMIGSDSIPITSGEPETSGKQFADASISFSQEIIWFEVGMLWDAKAYQSQEIQFLTCVQSAHRHYDDGA